MIIDWLFVFNTTFNYITVTLWYSVLFVEKWLRKWSLLNTKSAISWRDQFTYRRDDDVCFVLDQHAL